MKKKIFKETVDDNYSTKKSINYYNNWMIIIFSWLTSVTLLISWVLWIIFFKRETTDLLILIDNLITKKFFKFNLTFPTLTIAVLVFGFIILGVVAFPFIFLKNNDFISLILTRIMLWISLFFIIGSIWFFSFGGYVAFYKFASTITIRKKLFFIIPWGLEFFYFIVLIISCICFIKKSRKKKYMSLEAKALYSQNEINQNITSSTNNEEEETIWTPQQIEEVWNKGEIINNFNPQLYRRDYAGALMFWHNFIAQPKLNDPIESLNWTIVYERPTKADGTNYIKNLVPMNNSNAVTKGNNFPHWTTSVTYDSKKNKNIFKKKSWKHKEKNQIE